MTTSTTINHSTSPLHRGDFHKQQTCNRPTLSCPEFDALPRPAKAAIIQCFGKFYSASMSEAVREGKRRKVASGGWPCRAPFGYRNVQQTYSGRIERTVAVDHQRASAVRLAFKLVASEKYTFAEVLKLVRASQPVDGFVASKARLKAILRNPFYCGFVRFDGHIYAGIHEPIIGVALFENVQRQLSQSGKGAFNG